MFDNVKVTNKRDRMRVSGFRGEDTIVSNGSGNVSVSTLNESFEHTKLELSRVQDIPGLPDDIISLARLVEDDDYTFHAAPGGNIYLQHPDPEVTSIPVWIENGIFVLGECTQSAYVKSNQKQASWRELHKRLGHISKEAMVNTLQNAYGIKCKLDDLADFFCPTCAIANSKRKAISSTRNPDVKATRVGERIYVDIKSIKAVSRGGFSS